MLSTSQQAKGATCKRCCIATAGMSVHPFERSYM